MIFGIIFLSLSIAAYIAGIAWIYWDIKNEERGRKKLSGVQCKKCRYLLKDKDGYNWCPNKTDDPDIDMIRDCEWYAVKTNADSIRSMTDEELAVFLGRIIQSTMVGYAAIADKTNEKNAVLIHGWLEWLKQGASE